MSGGHFNYVGRKIEWGLEEISNDEEVRKRFPKLAELLGRLGPAIAQVEHEIDWDFSSDSFIEDDREFEQRAVTELRNALRDG